MKFQTIVRAVAFLSCGAMLFAGARAGGATTFNVRTTVDAACSVTSGPTDLTPTYSPLSNAGTGSATTLSTDCTGSDPTVSFSDAAGSGTPVFTMTGSGSHSLFYQISNKATCDGSAADDPIVEGVAQALSVGSGTYDICAAVITDGSNDAAAAGAYTDTVTYTVSP